MGLQYNIFFVRVPVDILKSAIMKTDGAIDETESLLQKQREDVEQDTLLTTLMHKKGKTSTKEFDRLFRMESDATKAYRARTDHQLQITLMSVPTFPEWTMGWYMHIDPFFDGMLKEMSAKILGFYLDKFAPLNTIYFMDFSSVCDDGDIYCYKINGSRVHLEEFPHLVDEEAQFERYVDRLHREKALPVKAIHRYYRDHFRIIWQYHICWNLPKNKLQ